MRRASRTVTLVLLAVLLSVVLMLQFLPAAREPRVHSVFSTEEDGRRALFLLLRGLGFEAAPWTRAPGHLEGEPGWLVLAGVPETPPGYEELDPDLDPSGGAPAARERLRHSRRLRDPLHYRRFVEEGGTLVFPLEDGLQEFVVETLGFEELAALERIEVEVPGEAASDVILADGERLELALPSEYGGPARLVAQLPLRRFAPLPFASPFETLVADRSSRSLVLYLPVGRGGLLCLADDRGFDNASIDAGDNALFLVRLAEEHAQGPILFDEYALGGWVPTSPLALAFAPANLGFSLHLAALVGMLLWAGAWAAAFPRDPEPVDTLAPLARAEGLAGLAASDGRWELLARMLQTGVLRRLGSRQGLRETNDEAAELDPEPVEHALRPLAGALAEADRLEHARSLFRPGRVTSELELAQLDDDLRALEFLARRPPRGPSEEARSRAKP